MHASEARYASIHTSKTAIVAAPISGATIESLERACGGSGFADRDMNLAIQILLDAQQRAFQQVQREEQSPPRQDKEQNPKSPKGGPDARRGSNPSGGTDDRLDELTFVQGFCQFAVCEVCCGKHSEIQQACRKIGVTYRYKWSYNPINGLRTG